MSASCPSTFLRYVLVIDAATCVAAGALMLFGAAPVSQWTAIPPVLLRYAGISLFPIAAFMAFAAARSSISSAAVWLIIGGNVLWVAASLWLMVSGWITPNALGHAFIGTQALAVAVLAMLEHRGLQRLPLVSADGGPLPSKSA